jgi:hypothetical protein
MTPPVVIHRTNGTSVIDRRAHPALTFFSADSWPFNVLLRDGKIVLIFGEESSNIVRLLDADSHTWLSGLENHRLTIDMQRIARISSPLAAWLCMVSSYGLPMTLTGVQQRVLVQLGLLRLDRLFTVESAA